MAENPIKTPLPADLPEDWTYGQTVAPTGEEAGLSTQHGYNYLMQQVNAAQRGVNEVGKAFSGLPSLGPDGKIPSNQLPAMNYDPAGSAAGVQKNLDAHTGNRQNPHGVTAVQVGAATLFGPVTVTVPVSGWAGAGPWTQTVTVAGVTAEMDHIGIFPVDVADATARKAYEKAYGCLAVEADTVAGGITLTCRDGKPETDFQIIVRGVK